MSYYGGTVTVAGRNLITSLMAGKTIEFTRIMVGSGAMPEGVEPIDMVTLVTPVAEGVSSVPTVENGVLSMVVEYRNDLNGGLQEGFWLREFGVFAKTEDTEEILLYYATLGDSPQPVNAYKDNRIDIRRYPISIALELDADVQITYNPGAFITSAEAEELVRTMVQEAISGVGTAIIKDITIPHTGWTWQEENPDEQGAWDMDEYGPAPDFSDATLSNVTRDILQKYSPETLENVRLKDDLELSCATSEWLFDGIDTIEGVVALLYTMAWAFAETRERLRMYEETRLSPLDLKDRLIAPFQNDMFAMVWGAFKKLYPDKECEIYWEPQIRDEEDGKPVYGLTDFADDGSVAVFVKPSLEVADAVEILAHELAHVAVGIEHDHDEVWQEAFDKIFEEYNRIGNQMFPNGEQCVMDDPDEK